MIENLDDSYLQKVHLFNRAHIRNNILALWYLAGVHRHYEFVYEPPFAHIKEVFKMLLKFVESLSVLD